MKTGLLLEGGAMRGLYTAGVLDVFMKNNISVDGIMGVSAGALFGMNYKSKQPEEYSGIIKSMLRTRSIWDYIHCLKQEIL